MRRSGSITLAALLAPFMATAAPAQETPATYLERIAAIDDAGPAIHAVVALAPEASIAAAARAKGPLAGHSVLVKDNIETRDMPTTAGSLALKDNATGRDAPLVARLRAAGAVILGKTNLSEWANFRGDRSSSGWSAVGGQTMNPHALDRSPCGSSSGSGAAVAAGLAWAAIGTETDGSITCPASVNGVVGFKPTVGLVSRSLVVPISPVQDTAGPMTTSVRDAALLLTAMAGPDKADPATAQAGRHAVDFTKGLDKVSLSGVRIGIVRRQVGPMPALTALFDQAVADMKRAGAEVVEIDYEPASRLGEAEFAALLHEFRESVTAYLAALPGNPPARDLAGLIAFNKAHAGDEMRWYGQELFDKALAATDAAKYAKDRGDAARLAGPEGIDALMAKHKVDALVAPTTGPAWPIDLVTGDHFLEIGAGTLAAVAGYPHLSVPMGAVEGLPVGLSVIAGKWDDARVLRIGAGYEAVRSAILAKPRFQPWQAPAPR
ncbi:amidase [Novosphingobium sp. AP12]|uniref:amidase n=1 Tax=Novosphingobium sp. AP12 TaxID=1144305 RepID=UPI0002720FC1|nr:amidase [Novosphingobium sp. AP12]EJL30541.1 amidase, Asp-tRNAAsn/Glu-tRNAGln amidotransferase A subunit [Novosphingobium sp. AP12]